METQIEKESVLLACGVTAFLYWYFIIRAQTKCITLNQKCDSVKCVKQKIN